MNTFSKANILGSDVLDHLGLVAASIDKLGIIKEIDKRMPMTQGAKTTHGQRAMAMILNGLGFMDDRLYMFPQFLKNKPVERLFGKGIVAEDFNDDALGRFLDAVHEYGETKLFSEIALPIALNNNLLTKSVHVDTTTLSVYGEYDSSKALKTTTEEANKDRLELPKEVHPEYGHAKNKRCDLKQMTLLMATTGKSGFPVWMESHSGNASDKKTLEEAASRMQKFCSQLSQAPNLLYVGDSAMYANCVKKGKHLLWLSRVAENINLARELLEQKEVPWISLEEGYKMYAVEKEYGGIAQRWVLIYSEQAYVKEIVTLEKNIKKEKEEMTKALWHLSNERFGCEKDIEKALKSLLKKLKYHSIKQETNKVLKYKEKGRPKKEEKPETISYQIKAELIVNEEAISAAKLTKGKFILASNELDKTKLPDNEMLKTYKEQSGTESGFKFIKDDAFEVSSIFLKKASRISALMMVMTLCLMVYGFAQYTLRQQLKNNQERLPSQSGKETEKPSMKWIYRLFHGVHVFKMKVNDCIETIILNLNELLQRIIRYFGEVACYIYDIPAEKLEGVA